MKTTTSNSPTQPAPTTTLADILQRLENSAFLFYIMDTCKNLYKCHDKQCGTLASLSNLYHCQFRILQEALFVMFGNWYIFTHNGECFGLTDIVNKDDALFWTKLAPDGSYIPVTTVRDNLIRSPV